MAGLSAHPTAIHKEGQYDAMPLDVLKAFCPTLPAQHALKKHEGCQQCLHLLLLR